MEINQLIIVVTFKVVYQKTYQIMHPKLLNFQHMNIFLETYILLQIMQLAKRVW